MKNRILTLFILLNLAALPKLFSQNVSINSTGNMPDTSAMLDVSSTTKGFLMPRMTTVQRNAIILPATGLTIFNTTAVAYQVNTGTPLIPAWSTLNAGAGSVSSVSVTPANGMSGTVATPTTTPAITLTTTVTGMIRGNGTSFFSASPGTDYSLGTSANATGIVKSSVGTGTLTTAVAADFPLLNQNTTGNAATATTVSNLAITNAKLALMPANTLKGNNTAGVAAPADLTGTQVTGMLDPFTAALQGVVPSSGGGTLNFLRADGTWQPVSTSAWSLTGNAGTNSGTNFLGTTDSVSLRFKSNGIERMTVDSLGNIGIGNPAPGEKLDVTGNVKFSGALMPDNLPGTVGSFLTSNGAGIPPTWTSGISGTNTGDVTLGTANGLSLAAQVLSLDLSGTSSTGALTSTDWNTFNNKLTTIDTTDISNFSIKVRSLISSTAPITYSNGIIGISQATTSTNGYLSSTDWNTFNNKASITNSWSTTGNAGTTSVSNFIGTTDNRSFKIKAKSIQGILVDSLGNIGIGTSPTFVGGVPREKFLVDAGSSTNPTTSYNVISGKGYIDNYLQLNIQNRAPTAAASSDIVASNDAATESVNFIDMGINSSANTSTGTLGGPGTAYLYSTGNDFAIGNASNNQSLVFFTDGTTSAKERMRIDGTGKIGIGTTTPATALHVYGTNPLTLTGVQPGGTTSVDSFLTINTGTVQKLPVSTFAIAANSWSTTGNTGTNATTNFIGTIDKKSFKIRTWNTQGFLLDSLGNVGIGKSPTFTTPVSHREKFLVDAGSATDSTTSYNVISGKGYIDNYLQLNIQNRAATPAASSDIVASNDAATEAVNFIDMGINSSVNTSTGTLGGPGTAYLYSTGTDFAIGNASNNQSLVFFTDGTTSAKERMRIDGTGKIGIGTTTPATALHVYGTNPLTLTGVQAGGTTSVDSFLTIHTGTVQKLPVSTFAIAANSWNTTGNTGTNSTTNFIGTIDKKSFKIKTWNTQGFLLDSLGNVGIGTSPVFTGGAHREKFLVDAGSPTDSTTSYNVISGKGYIDNYLQLNIQNRAATPAASSDIVASNDAATESVNFIDMGINSSANTSSGALGGINAAYLYSTGEDFAIGNAISGKNLKFFTGGTAAGNERIRITSGGNVGIGTITPNSTFQGTGSFSLDITTQTVAAYTATASDYTILCNRGSAMTINLPSAVGITGRIYVIKKISGASADVTIDANGTETIDGALTQLIGTQYSKMTIQSNNANWFIIAN